MLRSLSYGAPDATTARVKGAYPADDVGGATPTGFREMTEKEFAESIFFHHDPDAIEHRQFHPSPVTDAKGLPLVNAILYHFYDGTGIAMMTDFWAGKVRYFAFGCDHDYERDTPKALELCRERGITLYSRDHADLCTKCGHLMVVDSSD